MYLTDYDGEVMKEGRTVCVICDGKGEWNGLEFNKDKHNDVYANARRLFRVLEGGKSKSKTQHN